MKHYPSWRYHKSKTARIVKSVEEDLALEEGWAHSPAAFDSSPEPASPPAPAAQVPVTHAVTESPPAQQGVKRKGKGA